MEIHTGLAYKIILTFDLIANVWNSERRIIRNIPKYLIRRTVCKPTTSNAVTMQSLNFYPTNLTSPTSQQGRGGGGDRRIKNTCSGIVGFEFGLATGKGRRRRWEDNIKIDLQEVGRGCRDWTELAQDWDRWRALVSTVMNFGVP